MSLPPRKRIKMYMCQKRQIPVVKTARCKELFSSPKAWRSDWGSFKIILNIWVSKWKTKTVMSSVWQWGAYKGQQTYLCKTSCHPQNKLGNIAGILCTSASIFEVSAADVLLNFDVTFTSQGLLLGKWNSLFLTS